MTRSEANLEAQIPTAAGVVTIDYPRRLTIIDVTKVMRVLIATVRTAR